MTRPPRLPYGYVSWTDAARIISRAFSVKVTRQQVENWHKRQRTTGFSAMHYIKVNGRLVPAVNVEEALLWYRDYQPWKRGRDGTD